MAQLPPKCLTKGFQDRIVGCELNYICINCQAFDNNICVEYCTISKYLPIHIGFDLG